jgi:hypothetical protein
VRHASYGNSFTSSALNVFSVSSQTVTRNSLFPASTMRGSTAASTGSTRTRKHLCAHLQQRYESWFGVEFEFLLSVTQLRRFP